MIQQLVGWKRLPKDLGGYGSGADLGGEKTDGV